MTDQFHRFDGPDPDSAGIMQTVVLAFAERISNVTMCVPITRRFFKPCRGGLCIILISLRVV